MKERESVLRRLENRFYKTILWEVKAVRCIKQTELLEAEIVTASYDTFEEYADHCISLEDRGYKLLNAKSEVGTERMTAMYRRVTSK